MARRDHYTSMGAAWQQLRADFEFAKQSRFTRQRTGVGIVGRGADWHCRTDAEYLRMMELARDFVRNDQIVRQGLRRLVANVIQDGFTLNPNSGDKAFDQRVRELWGEWADDPAQCDSRGRLSWWQLERLAFHSRLVDGDVFLLPTTDGTLQVVEAHRVRTPANTRQNVVHGIKLDADSGRDLEAWITKVEIDPLRRLERVSDTTSVPFRDEDGQLQVFHCVDRDRISQTRGITVLAPVGNAAGMFDDIQFATLVKQQAASAITFIRTKKSGSSIADLGDDDAEQAGARSTQTMSDGSTRTLEGIGPGMELLAKEDETLEVFSPNIPSNEFFQHSHLVLSIIAVNLDMPVIVLMLDPSATNFSGWRGAMDQAKIGFRVQQRTQIQTVNRPTYRAKIRQWLEDSELGDEQLQAMAAAAQKRAAFDPLRHQWQPPAWPYIEPMKDRSAELLAVRNGLTSQRRRCSERSCTWDDLSTEIVEDNALAITKAKLRAREMNQDVSDPSERVTWREVLSLPTPDGVSITISDTDTNESASNGQDTPQKTA